MFARCGAVMMMPQMSDAVEHRRRTVYTLALITSIICIVGFGLDMAALSLRPTISSIEWRMGFMQQLGERCIILLFGGTLLCYGLQTMSTGLKRIACVVCGLGVLPSLSGFFYLHDSVRFRALAIENLTTQRQNFEQQIQQFSPESTTSPELVVDSAQKEKALKLLRERTQTLKSRTSVRIQKTVTRTFCSLLLTGIGLVTLGQMILRPKRFLRLFNHHETVL